MVGQWVNITDAASPSVNWMAGAITSFNPGTGVMAVNVVMTGGAGTLSNWVISAASAICSDTGIRRSLCANLKHRSGWC